MKRQNPALALAKSAGYAMLFTAVSLVVSRLCITLIGLYLAPRGLSDSLETVYYGLANEISILSSLIVLGILLLISHKDLKEKCGFRKTEPLSLTASVFAGFAAFLLINFLISYAITLFPQYSQSQSEYMETHEKMQGTGLNFIMEMVSVVLVAPLVEEVLCRGVMLNTLKKAMHPLLAILASASIFSLLHGNLYQIVFTLPMGLLLGFVAWRLDSLWPAILLHSVFNFSNYPLQIATHLGVAEDSSLYQVLLSSWSGFLYLCIPAGILLLLLAVSRKAPPPPAYQRAVPAPVFFDPPYPINEGEAMAAPEYIIVGLGNPGDRYAFTRHNAGFMAVDHVASCQSVMMNTLRFKSLAAQTVIGGKSVLLLKPQTFMNLSGEAVREAAAFYKIPPQRILVLFDDVSFAPGTCRIRLSGSAGGHNGIKSIIQELGSDAFPRIKLGVGQKPEGYELMNWVLGKFPPEDKARLTAAFPDVYEAVTLILQGAPDRAMQSLNGKTH